MSSIERICRACLQESPELTSFNENLSKNAKIHRCFENLTTIEIKTIEFNSKICKNCLEILKIAYKFKKQCLSNDEEYQKLLNDFKSTRNDVTLWDDQDIKEELEPNSEKEESYEFSVQVKVEEKDFEYVTVDDEAKEDPIDFERTVKCRWCDYVFDGKRAKELRWKHEKSVIEALYINQQFLT
jgi:hypothetical protein